MYPFLYRFYSIMAILVGILNFLIELLFIGIFYIPFWIAGKTFENKRQQIAHWCTFILFAICILLTSLRSFDMIDPHIESTFHAISIFVYVLVIIYSLYTVYDGGRDKDNLVNFITMCILCSLFGVLLFAKLEEVATIGIIAAVIFALLIFQAYDNIKDAARRILQTKKP